MYGFELVKEKSGISKLDSLKIRLNVTVCNFKGNGYDTR